MMKNETQLLISEWLEQHQKGEQTAITSTKARRGEENARELGYGVLRFCVETAQIAIEKSRT